MSKLVLFDIDGTILLSSGAGRRAIVEALASEVGPVEAWSRVRFDGKTDPQILEELLAAAGHNEAPAGERLERLGQKYVRLLEEQLARPDHRTTLLPGVLDLLDRVERESGAILGLLTGNFVEGAALKLRSGGLDPGRFKVGAYGSDSSRRTELPPIAAQRAAAFFGRIPTGDEVVIVGDTPADVACGECIGARAIAVATGSYSVEDLRQTRAAHVFPNLGDTSAVMTGIFG